MSRKHYLISYDIADPRRLRLVARLMEGYGHRIQFSVFQCPLDDLGLEKLKAAIAPVIKADEDQILIICLGPDTSQTFRRFDYLGKPYRSAGRITII
ncbi:MAG: CRISPR-associated endonuclease Cas2 [Desulfobacteraceae bacterium]|nr:CRISPR-associated endonuclease Cas2 [Desulfobacteraceae bacterium]